MKIVPALAFISGILAGAATANAAPVDLSTWTAESYPAVSGFGAGVWTVASGGGSVLQSVNGQPTIFYSDFLAQGTEVTGKIRVGSDGDDDFVGFVLGYDPGDITSGSADYLLVDWKQGTQQFDFGVPSTSGGGTAARGLAVSRVTGIPDADEFWQHANLGGTPITSGLTELARGYTLGSTGYLDQTEYSFTFDFGPNNLRVYVDSVLELDITGTFANGRLGFYNFSQSSVLYSAFEVEEGSFPVPVGSVPEGGTSGLLVAAGLLALAAVRLGRASVG